MDGDVTRIGAIFLLSYLTGLGGLVSRATRFRSLIIASVLLWSTGSGLGYLGLCDVVNGRQEENLWEGVRKKICR